jgi:hypothetical protein
MTQYEPQPVPVRKRNFAKVAIIAVVVLAAAGGGAAVGAAAKPEVIKTVEVEKIVEKEVVPAACVEALDYAQQGINLQSDIISELNDVVQGSDVDLITSAPTIKRYGEDLLGITVPYHTAKDSCLEK